MSRLIDADRLKYKIKCECNPFGRPSIDWELGKLVLSIIDEQPTVGEWIPCNKELPPLERTVVISTTCETQRARLTEIGLTACCWIGQNRWTYGLDEVIAWMPLPEPYEVEE